MWFDDNEYTEGEWEYTEGEWEGYDIDDQSDEVDVPEIKIKLDLNLTEDQLPKAISEQVKVMRALEEKILKAQERKNKAMMAAEKAKHDVRIFKKKEAIEDLQDATLAQSKALSSVNDAMNLLFSNQKQLANVSSGLFAFGLMNMASNRTMYQRLKCELEKASEEELNELAKEELLKIIRQLKAQEDIYNRIDRHSSSIEALQKEVASLKSTAETIQHQQKEVRQRDASFVKSMTDTVTNIKRQVDSLRASVHSSNRPSSSPVTVKKTNNGWTIVLAISALIISLIAIALVILA